MWRREVSSLRFCVSQMRKHTDRHTHMSASLKPYFVQLSTHHHLQSAQALPPFELHYLFSSRHLLPPPLSFSLFLALLSTVGFVAVLSSIEATYLFALFSTTYSLLFSSWHPVGNKTATIVLLLEFRTWIREPEILIKSSDMQEIHPLTIVNVSFTYSPNSIFRTKCSNSCGEMRASYCFMLHLLNILNTFYQKKIQIFLEHYCNKYLFCCQTWNVSPQKRLSSSLLH